MGRKNYSLWMCCLALLLIAVCCVSCAKTPVNVWQEQYDLGMRYLSEGNYEDAIIAFTAAIEIDSNNADPFVGRGDAYAVLAGQELDAHAAQALWEKAFADYERALELGDTQASEKIEESRGILQQFQTEYETRFLLETLYTRFADADIEGAKALMRQADYQNLSASVSSDPCYYDHGDGTGIAVYPHNYYYFGSFEGGLRSGQGLWICAAFEDDSLESYTYEGTWANDRPNGDGYIVSNPYGDQIQMEPSTMTSCIRMETRGTFVDGLYHGVIYEVWYMSDSSVFAWSPITAVDGVYQAIEKVGDDIVVAYFQNNELLDHGFVHKVGGLNDIA